ncbi:hypothetical protein AB0P17_19230 [Streptomyces sp. NPDC088124]|uniref:hypothetical protein n=1 Tax=Streptomyces sp. NPDC088124 TaxID=3154654 RepID=UPI00343B43B6
MTLSPQWEELFGPAEPKAQTRLASAGPGDAGGEADLQQDAAPWTTAAGVAAELHTTTGTARSDLDLAHDGVTWGLEGFTIGAILAEVHKGWDKRLGNVRNECSRLDGALKAVGRDFGETNTEVKDSFQRLIPKPPEEGR